MGAYPRDTGSNPVGGNGHFFPSYRQLYLSSFSDTHTHTHTHTRARARDTANCCCYSLFLTMDSLQVATKKDKAATPIDGMVM